MSIFSRLDKVVSRTADRINSITVCLIPILKTPNGRGGQDPNRDMLTIKGIFDYVSVEHGLELGVRKSYREANDLRALQNGRDPQVSLDRLYFEEGVDEPRQGDLINFPNNPELPDFEIISTHRDGLSRVVVKLAHKGTQR
jgi:hypothetical protein